MPRCRSSAMPCIVSAAIGREQQADHEHDEPRQRAASVGDAAAVPDVDVGRGCPHGGVGARSVGALTVSRLAAGGHSHTKAGRSSAWLPGPANCAAICSARSRVSVLMRKNPASCSCVSANGPSLAREPPLRQR